MRNREEEQNQVWLARWFRMQYPEYADLLTIASIGENVGPKRMHRLKEMGLTPGYPDLMLCLPLQTPAGYFHALFIEMKSRKGKVSSNQALMHMKLTKQGYLVATCYGWEQAKKVIEQYMATPSALYSKDIAS